MIDDQQPATEPTRLPPIRILDLLVLTTTMAFVFMIQEQFERVQTGFTLPAAFKYGTKLVYATQSGIALAGIYWLIHQKRVTGKFFLQPGHWILASYSVSITAMLIVWAVIIAGKEDLSDQRYLPAIFACFFMTELLSGAILILASTRLSGVWRWVTGTLSFSYLSSAITHLATTFFFREAGPGPVEIWISGFFSTLNTIAGVLAVLIVLYAIYTDRRKRISRDWLHWISLVILVSQSIAQPIFNYLFAYYANLNL